MGEFSSECQAIEFGGSLIFRHTQYELNFCRDCKSTGITILVGTSSTLCSNALVHLDFVLPPNIFLTGCPNVDESQLSKCRPKKGGSFHQAPPIQQVDASFPGKDAVPGWMRHASRPSLRRFHYQHKGESIQSKLINNMANTISNLNGTPQATQPERDKLPLSDGGTSESWIYEQRMTRWVPHDFLLV